LKLEFSGQIFENSVQMSKFHENILPVGAELYHTDGQADKHDEANSHSLQFCKRTKKKTSPFCAQSVFICSV